MVSRKARYESDHGGSRVAVGKLASMPWTSAFTVESAASMLVEGLETK
jgi:hypothetical protein